MHSKGGEDWALDMRSKGRDEVRTQLISLCGVGPKVRQAPDYGSLGTKCHMHELDSSFHRHVWQHCNTHAARAWRVRSNPSLFRLFGTLACPPVFVVVPAATLLNLDACFPNHGRSAGGRLYCVVLPRPGVNHSCGCACVAYCMPRLRPEFTGLQVRKFGRKWFYDSIICLIMVGHWGRRSPFHLHQSILRLRKRHPSAASH